ncbi:MAG: hypothetical protein LQ350_006991 [Teloschistes chrysophthalmus]|nr:MAG: hypothetical protein LQ350_006991 [Niorma chrysophthalma]
MPFSHLETIEAFKSFYAFLTSLPYIPTSVLQHAPSTCWPSITIDAFAPLGKTPEVLELLRHLLYIGDHDWNIAYDTKVIRYNEGWVKDFLEQGEPLEYQSLKPFYCDNIPAHVIPLTSGGNYGSWLMCDTIEGTITEYVTMGSPAEGQSWREHPTVPIKDFLESWKGKYMGLEWIATLDDGDIALAGALKEEELADLQGIYRDCGWPFAFRRDECFEILMARAIKARLQESTAKLLEKRRRKAASAKEEEQT